MHHVADVSLLLYIGQIEAVENEVCLISEKPQAICVNITMKLANSVRECSYSMTTIKNTLLSSYADASRTWVQLGVSKEETHFAAAARPC